MRLRNRNTTITIDFHPLADRLEELAESHSDEFVEEQITRELGSVAEKAAEELTRELLRNASRELGKLAKFRTGFEARLFKAWKDALNLFDLVRSLSTELGADLNEEARPKAAADQDFVFEALTRLHGRACLTASEIGALLRSGHATGANARWRTLHEIAVVAQFIAEHGQEVAKCYLEHDAVERYRAARQYQAYAERLGYQPFEPEEISSLHQRYEDLEAKHGRSFTKDYGWASEALGTSKPTFRRISAAIGLEHWAPYVRMASHGIHSGPRGGYFDMGLHPDLDAIPAGPSHFGLADPGTSALISLSQVTLALLVHGMKVMANASPEEPDAHRIAERVLVLAKMKSLQVLVDKGLAAFAEAHERQESLTPEVKTAPRLIQATLDQDP